MVEEDRSILAVLDKMAVLVAVAVAKQAAVVPVLDISAVPAAVAAQMPYLMQVPAVMGVITACIMV
jgi:hypothetical protein